jgi:aspartate/methionine/tyrosine aminotransferase
MKQPVSVPAGFRTVPRTGVIFVMTEAARHGYRPEDSSWANLGQGAPETGPLPGTADRVDTIPIRPEDHEYAPVDGLPELRDAVAQLYNDRYRVGKASRYTRDNVAICAGGRLALTRVVSTLGRTHLGHFLPDYTAYEELLEAFGTFVPIPILLDPDRQYAFSQEEFRREIHGRGLSALLLSNPCNPTGKLIQGETLAGWVDTARESACTLILDEFYSHYIYGSQDLTVSAAAHVEDVNADPIVILDGLTKNWRYPGWRICWTVAPKPIIDAVASAGSFLDGGCSRPMQRAAIDLLTPDVANAEAWGIQAIFKKKRQWMIDGLGDLGIDVGLAPQGGFYCWGDLRRLPGEINTGMDFFRKALEHQVIVVPGEFFDINPGQRRAGRPSRFRHHVRFSFGPDVQVIERGLENLRRMIKG